LWSSATDVPADICEDCGEYYLADAIARRVYGDAERSFQRHVEVEIQRGCDATQSQRHTRQQALQAWCRVSAVTGACSGRKISVLPPKPCSLKATPPEQRTDVPPAPKEKTAPLDQIVKLEKEMSLVQASYKDAESTYGSELLNLVVAKGYLTKLLANAAVKSYIERREPEILSHRELVANTVSMEEAMQQQGEENATH